MVACYGRIAKKQIIAENGSVSGREKKDSCSEGKGDDHESSSDHPEPASGHQILCADVPWDNTAQLRRQRSQKSDILKKKL